MHWIAVVNADAGSSQPELVDEVVAELPEGTEVRETADLDDLRQAVRDARGGTIVAMGGDGSIHAVVAAIDAEDLFDDVTLAIVPLGTGNDYARTVELPEDAVEAARAVAAGTEDRVDLIRDQAGRVVVNAVHVGLGAEATVRAKPFKNVLGKVGYAVGAIGAGILGRGKDVRVWVDGEELRSDHRILQVAVGIGRHIGGGAPMFPDADLSDGLLDVSVSWSEQRVRRLAYAWRLRRGRHPLRDDVAYRRGHEVRVVGEPLQPDLDGELYDAVREHVWTVEPGRLRLVKPAPVD